MIFKSDLPEDFKPYNELRICSNLLIGGKFIMAMGEKLPILIGSGKKPLIWLSAIVDSKKKHYRDLVVASGAIHPLVSIEKKNDLFNVIIEKTTILSISSKSPESATIHLLDLRPLGINIFGDENLLNVATNKFSSNTFQNVETMIGFP